MVDTGVTYTQEGSTLPMDGNGVIHQNDTDPYTLTVTNNAGLELPSTGGSGTRLYTIFGSILILGSGVLLWKRRRLIWRRYKGRLVFKWNQYRFFASKRNCISWCGYATHETQWFCNIFGEFTLLLFSCYNWLIYSISLFCVLTRRSSQDVGEISERCEKITGICTVKMFRIFFIVTELL